MVVSDILRASPILKPLHAARVQVLSTPELLIAILHFLPIRDLLVAQRLNHYFLNLIKDSLLLRQCLFLKPRPLKVSKEGYIVQGTEINTLLQEKFPYWFTKWTWVEDREDNLMVGIEAALLELQRKFEASSSFTNPDASWRKMLVAQPPIRQLRVMWCQMFHNRERNRSSMVKTPKRWSRLDFSSTVSSGLTMGHVYDQILTEITEGGRDFGIFWRSYSRKELMRQSTIPWDEYEELRGELLPPYITDPKDQPVVLQRIDLLYTLECSFLLRRMIRKKTKKGLKKFKNKAHETLQQGKKGIRVTDKERILMLLCDTLVGHVKWECYEGEPTCSKWVTDTDQRSPSEIQLDLDAGVWIYEK